MPPGMAMLCALAIFIECGTKAKVVDIFHGVIARIGIEIRPIDSSCRIRTNPFSNFRVIVSVAKIHQTYLFIDPFPSVSPRIARRGIGNDTSPFINYFFFSIDRVTISLYELTSLWIEKTGDISLQVINGNISLFPDFDGNARSFWMIRIAGDFEL